MSDKSRFHFTGICGTAMGSVAAAMKQRGFVVTGSDANVYPPMSNFLRDQGIPIAEGYDEKNIPADADVVVIGNAISRGNPEAEAALGQVLREEGRMAERGGFEPPLRLLTVNRFSKPAPSATRPPLRWAGMKSCAPTQGQVFSPILSGCVHVLMGLFSG